MILCAYSELHVTLTRYGGLSREFEEKVRLSRSGTTATAARDGVHSALQSVRENTRSQDEFQDDNEHEEKENHSGNNIMKHVNGDMPSINAAKVSGSSEENIAAVRPVPL